MRLTKVLTRFICDLDRCLFARSHHGTRHGPARFDVFYYELSASEFSPRVKSLLCESVRFVEVLVYCYISTALMRKTSKQTECGHAIGCELVKHKKSR